MLILFFVLFCFSDAQAQFLKNLQKKIEKKVENAVVEKASDKAADKASSAMDQVFDTTMFNVSKEKANPALVADTYDFTWKYSLKMTTKDGEMVFDYYLKPDANYFGFTSETMKTMFTVMDNANNVTVMFMESKGNNIGMVMQIPIEVDLKDAKNESEKFKFEKIPNKTINGFNCKGVKTSSDEYEMTMYFTNETEVSFNSIYKGSNAKIPTQFKDYFSEDEKVLMIFMDMQNLKKKKESATMECVGLEKVKKSVKKSDYKFM